MTWTDDETGRRRSRSFYGKTQREAKAKMADARKRLDAFAPVVDARTPLATWIDEWAKTSLEASSRKAATKSLYRTLARVHLAPAPLGTMALAAIRPTHVEALVQRMRDAGSSDSTIRTTYTVLRAVLDGAVRDKLVADNVAAKVKRPAVTSRADGRDEARHLAPSEVRAVLDAAAGTRYAAILSLIAGTGLRRGEALALRWEDVDLEEGVVRVRWTLSRVGADLVSTPPKTMRSRRDVPLTPGVVTLLRKHDIAQKAERLRAGSQWGNDRGLVFTTELGAPIDPRNLFRAFVAAVGRSGIDATGVGLHTLRHSAATGMLDAGVPLHVVSRVLGHSSVAITGDIYGHADDTRQRDAIGMLGAALGL
ncbi:tyrosine-type recombinase/integrase [Microbacterium sp.]|uniref:tyrosine-type recombinase/integrase n=1 Tax=Microbacterium sp. TaxID=51671 RepID=UPI003C729A0B